MAKERQNPVEAGRGREAKVLFTRKRRKAWELVKRKMASHKEDLVSALESSLQV